MDHIWRTLKKNGHWLFLAAVALLTVYMDVYIARFVLDGDASEYLYHGQTIAKHLNPFTNDVYRTTEVRPLDTASVFALFFLFVEDWTLVRILGTVMMQALYVTAYLFMCRQAKVSKQSAVFTSGLLLLPFSSVYARCVLYHVYYILYLTNAFWMVGLTIRILRRWSASFKKGIAPLLVLMGFWLYVGTNGVRHMMVLGLPLLALVATWLVRRLNEYRWERGKLVGDTPFAQTDEKRLTVVLILSFLFFLMGYWINGNVLIPHYDMGDISATTFSKLSLEKPLDILNSFLLTIGIRNSTANLIGVRGLSLAAALFSFSYLIAVSFQSWRGKEPVGAQLPQSMLAASLVTSTLLFLFESGATRYYEIYYIPVVVWAFPMLAAEVDRLKAAHTGAGKKLLILAVCFCLLFQSAYTALFVRTKNQEMDQWDGLRQPAMSVVEHSVDCVNFMQENGYTHGLILYWYANVMMEMTDGELIMAPLALELETDPPYVGVFGWGTSRSAFARENLPDEVIVFVPHVHTNRFDALFPQAQEVFDGWDFAGYLFPTDNLSW